MTVTINHKRGDTLNIVATIYKSGGVVFDLTGTTPTAQIRAGASSLSLTATITDATAGKVVVSAAAADMEAWDLTNRAVQTFGDIQFAISGEVYSTETFEVVINDHQTRGGESGASTEPTTAARSVPVGLYLQGAVGVSESRVASEFATAAQASAAAAAISATNAANSAASAGTSATNAANSATAAGNSATAAAASEAAAATSETNAAASEANAAASAAAAANATALLAHARDDAREGHTWSLADWYRDNASRVSAHPWYDATDIATLFQDTAGATPVTAPGDPVRLIKAKNGYTNHDLLIVDTLKPGIYRQRGGVGCVDLNSEAGFESRAAVTFAAPMFAAAAVAWRTRQDEVFGIVLGGTGYFNLATPSSIQNKPYVITNGSMISEQGLNTQEGLIIGQMPPSAPLVVHSQLAVGTLDLGVNALTIATKANTWSGTGSSASARISVGMSTDAIASNADADFFGGFAYFGVLDTATRALVVEYLRLKAERPAQSTDRHILILGDSTGDNAEETTGAGGTAPVNGDWPYRLMGAIATDNAGYHVSHRRYFHQNGWSGAEALQDGASGAILCWNASIAGAQPGQHLGANYAASIRDVPTCDTIIINHGYNIEAGFTTKNVAAMSAVIMGLIETAKAAHPGAHVFIARQPNKETPDADMLTMAQAVDALCTLYGATPLDLYDEFDSYAGPDDLWSDGLHFTEAGAALAATRAIADYNAALPIEEHGPGFLQRRTANALANGRFFEWASGLPTSWTKAGAGTVAEVLGPNDANPVAAQITDTGSTTSYMQQVVDATPYRSAAVTLGALLQVTPAAGVSPYSQIQIITNGTGGGTSTAEIRANWNGGWLWHFVQAAVPADATTITVRLWARAGLVGGMAMSYAEAVLVAGDKPRRAS